MIKEIGLYMAKIIKKAKTYILVGLTAVGLLVSGAIFLNQSEDEQVFLTVQEWRVLVEIYNEELQEDPVIEGVKSKAGLYDELDKRILEKAQDREKDEKNMIEGLLIKRNPENKDVIKKLRQ